MPVQPEVFANARNLGKRVAEIVATDILDANAAGRPFLLGCPGGRTPRTTYQALAALVAKHEIDLSHVVIVMMDEYVVRGANGSLASEDTRAAHSCTRFGIDEILEPLSRAASTSHGIPEANLWVPDPADPAGYDSRISDAGGIDVFLLASGASDGHVAFNPPGSASNTRTRVVQLPETTRKDNLHTFPSFNGELDRVPRSGVTVGIETIVALSASVIMLAHGADKALAARRLLAATSYDPTWPATCFVDCARPQLFIDKSAMAGALQARPI